MVGAVGSLRSASSPARCALGGAAVRRRGPGLGLLPRRRAGALRSSAATASAVLRARRRRRDRRCVAAGARGRAHAAGTGAEGGRRRARLRARRHRLAGRRAARRRRSPRALPPVDGLPLFGYGAIALLLFGTLLLMPRCARLLLLAPFRRCARRRPGLALAQLRGAPGQATRQPRGDRRQRQPDGVDGDHGRVVPRARSTPGSSELLPADLYFRAAGVGDSALLSPPIRRGSPRCRACAAPTSSARIRSRGVTGQPRVALLARTLDPAQPQKSLPFVEPPRAVPRRRAAAGVGERGDGRRPRRRPWAARSRCRSPGAAHRFTVAGVWRDYSRPRGTLVDRARPLRRADRRHQRDQRRALARARAPRRRRCASASRGELPGGERLDVGTAGEIRRTSLRIFDRTFAVTYALELAAMVIGLVGLSSSFAALVLARRREFGMLRHLGMTRGEIRTMLADRGRAGQRGRPRRSGSRWARAISLILIHVVNRQSFHWGMDLSVPWAALGAFVTVVLALSVATAVVAGRHATGGRRGARGAGRLVMTRRSRHRSAAVKRRAFLALRGARCVAPGGRGDGRLSRGAAPDTGCVFPRDHGAHPEFRTEWWYLTGRLADARRPRATAFR